MNDRKEIEQREVNNRIIGSNQIIDNFGFCIDLEQEKEKYSLVILFEDMLNNKYRQVIDFNMSYNFDHSQAYLTSNRPVLIEISTKI